MSHQTTWNQTTTLVTKMMNKPDVTIGIVICAAGSSTRFGSSVKKEYLPLETGTVLSTSVKKFINALNISALVITVPHNGTEQAKAALFNDPSINYPENIFFTEGGSTRQESVYNALLTLQSLKNPPEYVLIHDGARPFVTEKIITDTINAAILHGAAAPGTTPVDTQKLLDENNFIIEHLQRSRMSAIQTPQGFKLKELLEAHKKALQDNKEYTDDTEIWGKYCGKVMAVQGDAANKKITYASDYNKKEKTMNTIRTGLGYDIHRLVEGRKLIIGGAEFPFEKGEDGHSDGDALLHAITDALLGASGMGDIGSFFPPEEAKWKDADSKELLKTVWNEVKKAGWQIENIDCVVKLEKPKFLPRRNEVIDSIAKVLEVENSRVFVKAKTGEKMDSVGSGNAIEAWVTCLLSK